MGLIEKIKQKKHDASFGEWARQRAYGADILLMHGRFSMINQAFSGTHLLHSIFAQKVMRTAIIEILLNLYYQIDKNCPNTKQAIDQMIKDGTYNIEEIKIHALAFGIFLLRMAGYIMRDNGMNQKDALDFIACYLSEDEQIKKVYEESYSAFDNYRLISEEARFGYSATEHTFYKDLLKSIIDINKQPKDKQQIIQQELSLSLMQLFFVGLTADTLKKMCDIEKDLQRDMTAKGTPIGSTYEL